MKYHTLTPTQTYLVSIAPNEDIVASLTAFVKEHKIFSGYTIGIGAVKSSRFAHYSVAGKKYTERKFRKPLEILSITGIITKDKVHLHGVFGSQLSRAYGGHLAKAIVSAACELIVVATKEEIGRKYNEEIGLELVDL